MAERPSSFYSATAAWLSWSGRRRRLLGRCNAGGNAQTCFRNRTVRSSGKVGAQVAGHARSRDREGGRSLASRNCDGRRHLDGSLATRQVDCVAGRRRRSVDRQRSRDGSTCGNA